MKLFQEPWLVSYRVAGPRSGSHLWIFPWVWRWKMPWKEISEYRLGLTNSSSLLLKGLSSRKLRHLCLTLLCTETFSHWLWSSSCSLQVASKEKPVSSQLLSQACFQPGEGCGWARRFFCSEVMSWLERATQNPAEKRAEKWSLQFPALFSASAFSSGHPLGLASTLPVYFLKRFFKSTHFLWFL